MQRTTRWQAISLLTAAFVTAAPAAGAGRSQLRPPIDEAIRLLGWSRADTPHIELFANKPREVSARAKAWVRFTDAGHAVPIIYVWTGSEMYRDAARGNYQARVRLAGVLVHERWHVRHGRDHVGAYNAQLSIMQYLGANSLHMAEVRKALVRAEQQARKSARR
jgi:hypothetical protein